MLKRTQKDGEQSIMPTIARDQEKIRPSDGRRMPHTFNPVAIVHDAGEWYFYEQGDVIPDRHKTAGEKEAAK